MNRDQLDERMKEVCTIVDYLMDESEVTGDSITDCYKYWVARVKPSLWLDICVAQIFEVEES